MQSTTALTHSLNETPATLSSGFESAQRGSVRAERPDASAQVSASRRWTGRVLTGLSGLFLLLDGLMKVLMIAPVIKGSAELGYPLSTMAPIGVVLMISTLLYLWPRTAFYGALLLTGYLGGAIATHVRVEHPLFSHTLFPIYVAVMIWAGLALRDRRLEALLR